MRFIEAIDIKPTRSPLPNEDRYEPYIEAAIALGKDVVIVCRDNSPEWIIGAPPVQLKTVRISRLPGKAILSAGYGYGTDDFNFICKAELGGGFWHEDEIMPILRILVSKAFWMPIN